MRIREVRTYSELVAMKDEWKNVLERCEHGIFSTWEWLSTWWKHFGGNKRLLVLVAEENHRIVGIAPLMYSVQTIFGLRQGIIQFIGRSHSDYNDFIMTDKNKDWKKLFFDHINNLSENWSILELADIPENGNSIPLLRKISNSIRPLYQCHYSILPKSYDALLSSLKRKYRRGLERNLRRLDKDGFKVHLVDYSETQKIDDGMNTLFALHQKRWEQKGFSSTFSDLNFRNFNLEIARLFSEEGWLGLYSLELSGKPAAILYGFKYKDKYYAYIQGIDPTYLKYSIGNLLLLYVMNKCIQDQLTQFDMLRGAENYKKRWNTMTKWNFEAIVARNRTFGGFGYSIYRKFWSENERLRWFLSKLVKMDN